MNETGHVQVGHPVDVASGAVFTVMIDIVFEGTLWLNWRRQYSTDLNIDSWLGHGWTVPWFSSLERVQEGYRLRDESGRLLVFPVDQAADLPVGGSVISFGANMELVRQRDHFVIHHWHHGTDDVERFCFPITGSLHMPLGWLENVSGHRIVVDYDQNQKPVRLLQELEERRLEIFYRQGDLIEAIDQVLDNGSRKRLVRYEYDAQRRLVAVIDANNQRTSYEYDICNRLVREQNVLGSSFEFRYDNQNRCVHTYGDGGYLERRLVYATSPHRTIVTDSQGGIATYILNAAGQVIQQISPLGAVSATDYDEFGRPVRMLDEHGSVLHYEYDGQGNRCAVTYPDGARSETKFNEFHLLSEYVAPSGATWRYSYNSRGEAIGMTTPLGNQYTAVRDGRGLVVEFQMPSGRTISFRYGRALRWVEAADQISLLTRTEFDECGNQISIFDAQGLVQRAKFDAMNRVVLLEDGVGRVYRVGWNALGQRVELSGPGIPWERRVYDLFGQIVEHVNLLGTIRSAYDTEGRLIRITNRVGEQLTRTYDADGRLMTESGFDGRVERFDYSSRKIINTRPDNRTVVITYDALGLMIRREASDQPPAEFKYDVNGHLIAANTKDTTLLLERDAEGRVTAEIQSGRRIEYSHDGDGDRNGRRIPGVPQSELRLMRDARKQIIGVGDAAGTCMELSWDNVGRMLERRFAGVIVEKSRYDDRGRLALHSIQTLSSTSLVERKYEYDDDDYLVAREERNERRSLLQHDGIGRLVSVEQGGRTLESYSYNANGAILSTHRGARTLGPGGAAVTDGSRHYEYANDGSVRQIGDAQGVMLLEHDVEGRVVKSALPNGRVATYGYDALGRRAYKEVDGKRTDFLWEGPVLAAEFEPGQPVLSHYFFGFEPLVQWSGRRRLMPATDISGLVREVFDESGRATWQGRFDAYGNLMAQTGSTTSNIRFRGQYFDAETGLHYNFNRTYDPRLCDYLAPDPIGLEGGTHFYLYPRNPYLWDDPFGLSCDAHRAEKSMDGYFGAKGYKKIGARGKDLRANGIDAIYYKKGGRPPYIIAEGKSGGAVLGMDKFNNQQMSDAWINGRPGGKGNVRLDGAFPKGSKWPDRIDDAAAKGNVGKVVYNPDKSAQIDPSSPRVMQDPKVQQTGTYGGAQSTTQTF